MHRYKSAQLSSLIEGSLETRQTTSTKATCAYSPEMAYVPEGLILLSPAAWLLVSVQSNHPSSLNSIYFSDLSCCCQMHPRARTAHNDAIFFLEILCYVQANEPTAKWQMLHEDLQTWTQLSSLTEVIVMPSYYLNLGSV